MKNLSIVAFLATVATMVTAVSGLCTSGPEPCQEGSGSCSNAIFLAIAGNMDAAMGVAKYGKYCGATNKCQVSLSDDYYATSASDQTCAIGAADDCPAIPCDPLDSSCSMHDSCLDELVAENPPLPGQRLAVPARCTCDASFVAALAAQTKSTEPTGLCDKEFYTKEMPQLGNSTLLSMFGHESVLMALPFCCGLLEGVEADGTKGYCQMDAKENGYTKIYETASAFCTAILKNVKDNLGLDLCNTPTPPPAKAPTKPTKCERVVYRFEEFSAGDTIKELGEGDISLKAKRFSTNKKTGKVALRRAIPMAFDSANPSGGDWDLATNNQGMVLIVSEDGDASDPDDTEFGGQVVLKLKRSGATVKNLVILDAEEGGSIVVFHKNGPVQKFKIPRVRDGKRTRVKIGVTNVTKLLVKFKGSAAIANIVIRYCNARPSETLEPTSSPTATAQTYKALISSIPGTDSDVKGTVFVFSKGDTMTGYSGIVEGLHPLLSASDCTAVNGCGVHIHSGFSCESQNQGGHFWMDPVLEDPWVDARYSSDQNGLAYFDGTLEIGTDDLNGRAFVVHAEDGSRVGCGILELTSSHEFDVGRS